MQPRVGKPPATAAEVSAEASGRAEGAVGVVYRGLRRDARGGGSTNRLAEVAAEDALEALYLERIGALAEDGLEPGPSKKSTRWS